MKNTLWNLLHTVKDFFKSLHALPLAIITTAMLYGCAQPAAPEGGPRDTEAPVVEKAVPANYSVNFNSKTILLEFNEYIRLNNLNQKLLISPYMEEKPEVSIKGKSLYIELQEDPEPGITYTLHFADAIVDNNEGNPLENFKYVFSTGDFIDSMRFSGKIVQAQNLEPAEGVYMMLYSSKEDSVPYLQTPSYLSKTDEKGMFRISNIKKGKYKAFALKDQNSNYLFDLPNEEIAFTDSLIKADTTDQEPVFRLFEEDHKKQYLKSFKADQYGRFSLVFNLPVKNLGVSPLNQSFKKQWFIRENNAERDSITYWLTGISGMDSLKLKITDRDSILDTLHFKLPEKSKLKKDSLEITSNISSAPFDLHKNIDLILSHPIIDYDTSRISFMEDSIPVKPQVVFHDSALRVFELHHDWKENTDYRLMIPPGTFSDIFEMSNDSFLVSFKTQKKNFYASLSLKINMEEESPKILQLLDEKNSVVREIFLEKGETKVSLNHLKAGKYKLKLILDENSNKTWDTGNYIKSLQPEKVILYKKDIDLKANWEQEIEWVLEKTKP